MTVETIEEFTQKIFFDNKKEEKLSARKKRLEKEKKAALTASKKDAIDYLRDSFSAMIKDGTEREKKIYSDYSSKISMSDTVGQVHSVLREIRNDNYLWNKAYEIECALDKAKESKANKKGLKK